MNTDRFDETIPEHEAEGASNSYLMSLVAVIMGLPLPFVNLLASVIFYLSNRKAAYFVRWHCTQALLSQLSLFFINSYFFWWTVYIIATPQTITVAYLYFFVFLLGFNILEFGATIYAAIQTRKGLHVRWWIFGSLTDMMCEPKEDKMGSLDGPWER